MNIQIHSVRFDADKKLLDFVSQKMNKLSQVSDDIVSAEVFLRLDHDDERENKVAEIEGRIVREALFLRVSRAKPSRRRQTSLSRPLSGR